MMICKNESDRDLVTRVYPRLKPFTCSFLDFSLVLCDIYLCSASAVVITLVLVFLLNQLLDQVFLRILPIIMWSPSLS